MKKTYTVTCADLDCSITVEIDHAMLTEADLHVLNNFWSDHDSMLDSHDGNVTHAVLERILRKVMYIQIVDGWTIDGLIRQFNFSDPNWNGATEGFPKMDGSDGIRIVKVEDIDFDAYTVEVSETTVPEAARPC